MAELKTYHVTFDVAVPGVAVKTLTRAVQAESLEEAITFAKNDLVTMILRAGTEAGLVPPPPV